MESIKEDSEKIVETPLNFFSYVFNFDKDSREDMLNIIQYSFLAVLIIVFFNKGMQKLIPPADEDKGTPSYFSRSVFTSVPHIHWDDVHTQNHLLHPYH